MKGLYYSLEKKLMLTAYGRNGAEAARAEFLDQIKLKTTMQENWAKKKKMQKYNSALKSFYRRAGMKEGKLGIHSIFDPQTGQISTFIYNVSVWFM